jgi:hypothetical protein
LLAAGLLLALPPSRQPADPELIGLVLVAGAGLVPVHWAGRIVFALPGAWLIAFSEALALAPWMRGFLLVVIPLAGGLLAEFDGRYRARALAPSLFALTTLGVFFAVPDTERALLLLGVAAPFALAGWPRSFASLGSAGSFAVVGALMWTIATDSAGRPASVLGATAALGLLVVEPLVRGLLGRSRPGLHRDLSLVAGAQLLLVFLASRVAARADGSLGAIVLSVAVIAVGGGLSYVLSRGRVSADTQASGGQDRPSPAA